MHEDALFLAVGGTIATWALIAIGYALVNYAFDTIGCWLSGGVEALQSNVTRTNWRSWRLTFFSQSAWQAFVSGGRSRWVEFRSDTLSWLWPITILAIPTFVYGLSHHMLSSRIADLERVNLSVADYRWPLFSNNSHGIQYFVLAVAIAGISISFWQYHHRPGEEPTWFAKSKPFHIGRVLFFDMVLAYMVLTTVVVWTDFMSATYRALGDDGIGYQIFASDLMYGLRPAYDMLIVFCTVLLLFSLLPLIMLVRERGKRFEKLYTILMYASVVAVVIVAAVFISRFHSRLGWIQATALEQLVNEYGFHFRSLSSFELTPQVMHYYDIVSRLPGGIPVPRWLEFFITARVVVIPYEVYLLLTEENEPRTPREIFRRVLGTIA